MEQEPRAHPKNGQGIRHGEQDDQVRVRCPRHVADTFHCHFAASVQIADGGTVSVCIVFCPRPVDALLGTLKGKKLKNCCVGSQGANDGTWSARCMIGDFLFPLGRQSAAAGHLYSKCPLRDYGRYGVVPRSPDRRSPGSEGDLRSGL